MVEPEFEPGQTDPRALPFNYDTSRLLWVLCDRDSKFSFSILLSSQLHLATSIYSEDMY